MWKKTLTATLLLAGLLQGTSAARSWSKQERKHVSNAMLNQLQGQTGGGAVYQADSHLLGILEKVLRNVTRHDLSYQLLIEQDDNSINAYALPDGRVVLLTGLIRALPQGDDGALAFVMAHEISHVEKRHVERLSTQSGLTNLGLGWLSGQNELLGALSGIGSNLLVSGYSRGMEAEADQNGLELMRMAGYNPRGALVTLQLFRDLEARDGQARVFPTHPTATDRYNDTQAYIQQHDY